MQADNFEYDGYYLNDFGFVMCDFDGNSGTVVKDGGVSIKFNKVAHHGGKRFSLTSTKYESCLTASLDICKDPEVFTGDDFFIEDIEYRDIVRWLNRREFRKLRFIDSCKTTYETVYYNASFNVSKITIGGRTVGIRLAMETDSPVGHGVTTKKLLSFNGGNEVQEIADISDEIGTTQVRTEIYIKSSGNLELKNRTLGTTVVVKNCTAGETITIDSIYQTITSSRSGHDLAKDFNFEFFCIGNTLMDRFNEISASLACDVTIEYDPVIKDIP